LQQAALVLADVAQFGISHLQKESLSFLHSVLGFGLGCGFGFCTGGGFGFGAGCGLGFCTGGRFGLGAGWGFGFCTGGGLGFGAG
jgi:hypothetical protein